MADKRLQVFVYPSLQEKDKQFLLEQLPGDIRTVFNDELEESSRRELFASSTFVYGNPPPAWLAGEVQIRWIQLNSAGFDAYQHLKLDIPVSNMHGYFAQPCAETAVAGIMALYRGIDQLVLLNESREWKGKELRNSLRLLQDKKVVILGAGTIAVAIRELLEAFRCHVSFYARSHPEARLRDKKALIGLLPEVDILINTLPGTSETSRFVSAEMLEAMNPAAIFVNIGRGSTVDEPALISRLQSRKIAGAVLDVTWEEPLPAGHPLWSCPNTMLTQHTGGGTAGEEKGIIRFFIQNLNRFLKGDFPRNTVNFQKGY